MDTKKNQTKQWLILENERKISDTTLQDEKRSEFVFYFDSKKRRRNFIP